MNPFMIAVEKGHLKVVNAMMEKDPGLVSLPMGSGSTMIHWALEKDHHRSAFFKVYFNIFIIIAYETPIELNLNTCRVSLRKMQKLCSLQRTLKETQLHTLWLLLETLKCLR